MSRVTRGVKLAFWICAVVNVGLIFFKFPLPDKNNIGSQITDSSPKQTETELPPQNISIKGFDYELQPLYRYDVSGLVVAEYTSENFLDFSHKSDPANTRDLCLVWGSNISSGVYREVKYKHGEFTCYWGWDKPLNKTFDPAELSNNHLVPQNPIIQAKIRQADVGDQVRIGGYLVNYKVSQGGTEIGSRITSTTRSDTGNGACEIILVTDFEILTENLLAKTIRKWLPILLAGLFVTWLGLKLVPEPESPAKIIFDRVS